MKKTVLTLALASMFAGAGHVQAQGLIKKMMSNLYGGPKVEANVSNFFISDMPEMDCQMNIGGSVGGFVGVRMSEHFAIQEDMLLSYKTSNFENDGVKGDYNYLGVDLTFYAMGNWKLNNGSSLSFGIGPFASYGINAKYKVGDEETDLYEKNDEGKKAFKPLNVGGAITAGYEFKCGLQINASYKIGVLNTLDSHDGDATLRPSAISMGIAYRFGK